MKIRLKRKSELATQEPVNVPANDRINYLFELISLSLKLTPDHAFTSLPKKYSCSLRKKS